MKTVLSRAVIAACFGACALGVLKPEPVSAKRWTTSGANARCAECGPVLQQRGGRNNHVPRWRHPRELTVRLPPPLQRTR